MKISIISTTYNRKDFLLQTMESVQKSILAPLENVEFEHVIYDDASNDGTEEAVKKFPAENIKYIAGHENKGPSYGRNTAIEQCSGEYIFLIDSDDIVLQRTLYNFVKMARQYPDTSWFVADFLRVDKDLRYRIGEDYYAWDFKDTDEMLTAIFKGQHFLLSSIFFKKDIFDEVGGFDEHKSMAEDLDLCIRFLFKGHMPRFCAFISHLHRNHASAISAGITLDEHMKEVAILKAKYFL